MICTYVSQQIQGRCQNHFCQSHPQLVHCLFTVYSTKLSCVDTIQLNCRFVFPLEHPRRQAVFVVFHARGKRNGVFVIYESGRVVIEFFPRSSFLCTKYCARASSEWLLQYVASAPTAQVSFGVCSIMYHTCPPPPVLSSGKERVCCAQNPGPAHFYFSGKTSPKKPAFLFRSLETLSVFPACSPAHLDFPPSPFANINPILREDKGEKEAFASSEGRVLPLGGLKGSQIR